MTGTDADIPREDSRQLDLFHYSPQQVSDEIGINWLTAVRLHESGWLNFDPAKVLEMNEGQETEFRFLGALAAAGCDDRMLAILLKSLQKPYLYNLNRIYYDLGGRDWIPIPTLNDQRDEMFQEWIEDLVGEEDDKALRDLRTTIEEALARLDDAGPEDEESETGVAFTDQDTSIVQTAILLLRKAVQTRLPTTAESVSIGKTLYALEHLPNLTSDITVTIDISGPRRMFGEHEIWHWWQVEILPGEVQVSSGGHFYRKSTGGDTFTIMQWTYVEGNEPEFDDYLDQHGIVDDAQRFEPEVEGLDFSEPGYTVTVTDDENPCLKTDELEEGESTNGEEQSGTATARDESPTGSAGTKQDPF